MRDNRCIIGDEVTIYRTLGTLVMVTKHCFLWLSFFFFFAQLVASTFVSSEHIRGHVAPESWFLEAACSARAYVLSIIIVFTRRFYCNQYLSAKNA